MTKRSYPALLFLIGFQKLCLLQSVAAFVALTPGLQREQRDARQIHRQASISDREEPPSDDSVDHNHRRLFMQSLLGVSSAAILRSTPAWAGIDVSGLRTDTVGNPALREQLKSYDGSASSRVQQLKELSSPTTPTVPSSAPADSVPPQVANWAYRSAPGFNPKLTKAGPLGTLVKLEDSVVGPSGSNRYALPLSFEFPGDWLQLDKFLGGLTYVDQRNGDRLYVLRTKLPDGERLATVPKQFMGQTIFDPQSVIVKSQGVEVDDYRVASSTLLNDAECGGAGNICGATHRRFKIKYSTVTGNGLRVERRALVDAYEMSSAGEVYFLMTSSNAVKFEANGRERETVEAIVDSFRINV